MIGMELVEAINKETWIEGKQKVVDKFLYSHQVTKKTPVLVAENIRSILDDVAFGYDKFKLLDRLHPWVDDRESLRPVIEAVFSVFDQPTALLMVGLPVPPKKF